MQRFLIPYGFTLIELLLVIVVIGILAATAVPRFLDAGTNARRTINKGVVASLNTAIATLKSKAILSDSLKEKDTGKFWIIGIDADPNSSTAYYFSMADQRNTTIEMLGNYTPLNASDTKRAHTALDITDSIFVNTIYDDTKDSTEYQTACNNIFNALLDDPSIKASTTTSTAYQSVTFDQFLDPDPKITSAPSPPPKAPSPNPWASQKTNTSKKTSATCLWKNTGSLNKSLFFYIFYHQYTGRFYSLESSKPPAVAQPEMLPPPPPPEVIID